MSTFHRGGLRRVLSFLTHCAWLALIAIPACGDDGPGGPGPVQPGCFRLGDHIHSIAVGRPEGITVGGAVHGSSMFSLNGAQGIRSLDFSDPSDVRVVATLGTITDARAVESSGPWLFVANGDDGLAVVDVTNPGAPRVARIVPLPGAVVDVRVAGERAYLANDQLGLVIVDVANPANAAVLGIENTPGKAVGVAVSGTLAALAMEPGSLRIVNVSDPSAPFIIESLAVPGFVEAVDAKDGVVAVAVGQAGVQLVDISRPAASSLAGRANTPVDAIGVALAGDLAFVADASGGAIVLDVSDIAHPLPAGSLGSAAFTNDVAVSDGHLVISDDAAGLRVLDITPPVPAPADSLAAEGNVVSLSAFGNLVVAADASYGLLVIDPAARSVIGRLAMTTAPREVAIVDSTAYVARVSDNIAIVDLRDPAAPVATGEFGLGQDYDHLDIAGNFGYLVDESGWLYEERINPPQNTGQFRDVAVIWTSVTAVQYLLFGTVLYVPDARGTVLIIPSFRMTPINELPVSASPQRVVIQYIDGPFGPGTGMLAYVVETGFNNGQSGVEVFDVTDPYAPILLGKIMSGGNAFDVAFAGTQVVVGEGDDGAEVFDLLDTARARPMGLLLGRAMRVAVAGGTLAAAGGKSGVLLVSLEDCLR